MSDSDHRKRLDSLVYFYLGQAASLMERSAKHVAERIKRAPGRKPQPYMEELLSEMAEWQKQVSKLVVESLREGREDDGADR